MKERVFIAGSNGMVGSAIKRRYQKEGNYDLILRSHKELDLIRQSDVEEFFKAEKPDYVVVASAKVGGILANSRYRAQFLYENILIESNIIHSAYLAGVKKLLFLGSSCIYPRMARQPIKEEYLLTGSLESTNEPYAIAKITGIKLAEAYYRQYGANFISAMPTNLYGPYDNFNLETSHVLPALLRKFHEAKTSGSPFVNLWGTGTVLREFLYVEDLADACYFLMQNLNASRLYDEIGVSQINVGTGEDQTIASVAETVKNVTGYSGEIRYDSSKPDGTPRKLLDVKRLEDLGWKATTGLEEGIRLTYEWFLKNLETGKLKF